VVFLLCAAGVTAVALQVRCIDAAREVARLAARGDRAADHAAALAPAGSSLDLRRDGRWVVATIRSRSPMLPGIVITGRAVAAAETAG